MIRPDEIVTALGGRVMEGMGVPFLQQGRIGQDSLSSFARSSKAWARVGPAKWAELSTNVARYELHELAGELHLALTLESSGTNLLGHSAAMSSTLASWGAGSTGEAYSAATSVIQGQSAYMFTGGALSTAGKAGLYQDVTVSSTWVALSAIVEQRDAAPFAFRIGLAASTSYIVSGELGWGGDLTVSRGVGASTTVPARGHVERLGTGPNGGRAYRVGISALMAASTAATQRVEIFPTNNSTTTGQRTYLHHAQLSQFPHVRRVMVSTSSSPATREGETLTLPSVAVPGGPLSLYQELILYDRPGGGSGTEPLASTAGTATRMELVRGWTSTDGTKYVAGGSFENRGLFAWAGSTGAGMVPGQRLEEALSLSTAGQLKYQYRLDGGTVYTAVSTGVVYPVSRTNQAPSYAVDNNQMILASVIARGVHSLEDFSGLFR